MVWAHAVVDIRIERNYQICRRVARFDWRRCRDGESVGDQGTDQEEDESKCLHIDIEWWLFVQTDVEGLVDIARSLVDGCGVERCNRSGVMLITRFH